MLNRPNYTLDYLRSSVAHAPLDGGGQQSAAQAAYAANMQARRLWVSGAPEIITPQYPNGVPPAVNMWQRLNPALPGTVAPGTQLQARLNNVGLIKRVVIEIAGTITTAGGAGDNVALTPGGLANLFSTILFTDLANNQRINTTGWHLIALSTSKRHRPWGSAVTTDTPFGYASTYAINTAPATIAGSGTARTFRAFFEVPFVRHDRDLRGAIWGAVSTAVMNLQVTLNPNMFVSNVGDPTNAVYQNAASANLPTLSGVTWQVYQNYLDQGPRTPQGLPILPRLDVGTAYLLNNTVSPLPIANQNNAVPFVNQRQFLSLAIWYDNAGVLNPGTDISAIQLTSANLTNILDYDAFMAAHQGRLIAGDDFPKGMYWLDFSDRPIDTQQFGNMQIILNPSSVGGATALFNFGWEAYGVIGAINQGGALPSGA